MSPSDSGIEVNRPQSIQDTTYSVRVCVCVCLNTVGYSLAKKIIRMMGDQSDNLNQMQFIDLRFFAICRHAAYIDDIRRSQMIHA